MKCPHCGSSKTKKNGWYRTQQQRIQKYRCGACKGDYTAITEDSQTKQEHRPELNDPVIDLHLKGVSQRDIADRLGCSRTTVQRKLKKYL